MKRSLSTALAAVVASPVLIGMTVLGANPAAASGNCDGVYPPGQRYNVAVSPSKVTITRGSQINLISRVSRGGVFCNGQAVRLFVKYSNERGYQVRGVSVTRRATLGDGYTTRLTTPPRTFAWFQTVSTTISPIAIVNVRAPRH